MPFVCVNSTHYILFCFGLENCKRSDIQIVVVVFKKIISCTQAVNFFLFFIQNKNVFTYKCFISLIPLESRNYWFVLYSLLNMKKYSKYVKYKSGFSCLVVKINFPGLNNHNLLWFLGILSIKYKLTSMYKNSSWPKMTH